MDKNLNPARVSIAVILILILSACGTAPKKSTHFSSKSDKATQWFEQGQQLWRTWEQSNRLDDLREANAFYKKAYDRSPDNGQYQHANYLSSIYLGFYSGSISESELLPLFKKLPTNIQAEVPPPARMVYAISNFRHQHPETLIPIAKRAIQQKPTDALSWKQLSEQYSRLDLKYLAAATANRAVVLDDSVGEYNHRLGETLSALASNNHCNQQANNLRQRAIYYLAKSAAQQNTNPEWYAQSAHSLLDIGLFPLAEHQIQLSRQIKITETSLAALVRSRLLSDSIVNDALLGNLENIQHSRASYIALAMAAAASGEWTYAYEFMSLASDAGGLDTSEWFIALWLSQLAEVTHEIKGLNFEENKTNSLLTEFLLNSDKTSSEMQNEFTKLQTCNPAKKYLFLAMKYWQENKANHLIQNLNQAKSSEHYWAHELAWATAINRGISRE